MDNYLEVYEHWYPRSYGLDDYPTECHVTYSGTERRRIFEKLTDAQQAFVNQQRKYEIRSLFLQQHYLQTSDWEFVALNIDDEYERGVHSQLKCACGRPLKYQFVIKSKSQRQEIRLGIQHFKDHLGISQQVAEEIKKGVAHVDLALDELLWLTEKELSFPEDLWQRYVFAYYRNNTLRRPLALNHTLAKRVVQFRHAQMPLFIGDYLSIVSEINQIDREVFERQEKNFLADKNIFEAYLADFQQDIQAPIYLERQFWKHKLTDFIQLEHYGAETAEEAKIRYFDELLSFLLSLKNGTQAIRKIRSFRRYHQTKYGNEELAIFIIEKYQHYQFTQNFFLAIPKVYRIGIKKAIQRKQKKGSG
ncbi:hypothetical protein [Enterococcus dongliensis]|uniref:hypothetical protein n=1 Tax=Enterococcus dongliensis TaxID=2559925 RepID=UPI00289054A8|nr:hypothetical protein [Enterococcus dongliensis]MDT2670282.1 hypothetical protein [Enterococcus dongliensis]